MTTAYLFEARSIQRYILDSNRLRDMVGASAIVERLCNATLDETLATLSIEEVGTFPGTGQVAFSRRNGGSLIALFADRHDATQFRALWNLVLGSAAPGLEWIDTIAEAGSATDTLDAGHRQLAARRNRPAASVPEIGPFVMRSPRTGGGVVASDPADGEWLDEATDRKRAAEEPERDALAARCLPEGCDARFPRNLEPQRAGDASRDIRFPFQAGSREVAVIHADGNGLGKVILSLRDYTRDRDDFIEVWRGFSNAVANATQAAAQRAARDVLLPHAVRQGGAMVLPARPIVLGGDDMTFIVRADCALSFAEAWVTAFEEETMRALAGLQARIPGLPRYLTACAGVVTIGASQPFRLAHDLAESLCKAAKTASKKVAADGDTVASSLVFHRQTTSQFTDYDTLLARELTVQTGDKVRQVTLSAYRVGAAPADALPALADLRHAASFLASGNASAGPLRQALTALHEGGDLFGKRYRRWRSVLEQREKDAGNPDTDPLLGRWDEALQKLGVSDARNPWIARTDTLQISPLGDIQTLLSIRDAGVEGA